MTDAYEDPEVADPFADDDPVDGIGRRFFWPRVLGSSRPGAWRGSSRVRPSWYSRNSGSVGGSPARRAFCWGCTPVASLDGRDVSETTRSADVVRVEYATERTPDGTTDNEVRIADERGIRGTITVDPTPSGSRVTVDYECLHRFSPMDLVLTTVGERFADRPLDHLGYEVVDQTKQYRLRR